MIKTLRQIGKQDRQKFALNVGTERLTLKVWQKGV